MNEEQKLLALDIKEKIRWSVWVRYGFVALGLFLVYFAYFDLHYISISFFLLGFVFTYNLIADILSRLKIGSNVRKLLLFRNLFLVLDVFSVTILIYITGLVNSPFWFLYLVLIIIAGFGFFNYSSFTVFLIAFFSTLFYLGLFWFVYFGVIPVHSPSFSLGQRELLNIIFNKAVFISVSFFLFATTIFYFSQLISQHKAKLSRVNRQLLGALEELKNVDQLKDEFISTASHELRTPLSIVRENMSLIEDGIVGAVNDKQKDLLSSMKDNIDRLAKIIENLLDVSRAETRAVELERKEVDLVALVDNAVKLLQAKAAKKRIIIEAKLPAHLMAWVDQDQIIRVFINLIDNAIKYTQEKGMITVGLEEGENEVTAYVTDNGVGIDNANAERIFDRFVRIEKDLGVTPPKGFGLGLAICKEIIDMHGGRLWVESKYGQGSRFVFTLPKVENDG